MVNNNVTDSFIGHDRVNIDHYKTIEKKRFIYMLITFLQIRVSTMLSSPLHTKKKRQMAFT